MAVSGGDAPRRAGPALVAFVALAVPAAAAAQAPGYRGPTAQQLLLEYRDEVLRQVGSVVERWTTAWNEDDADGLAELYAEDALLVLPGGEAIWGREAVRAHLRESLPGWGVAALFLQDFDARGGMAVGFSNYVLDVDRGGSSEPRLIGPVLTVYRLSGRSWRIQSQAFR